jgi:hypothetical protein
LIDIYNIYENDEKLIKDIEILGKNINNEAYNSLKFNLICYQTFNDNYIFLFSAENEIGKKFYFFIKKSWEDMIMIFKNK